MQYKPKVFWQLSVIHWKYDSHDRLNWSTWISFKLLPNVNRAQTTAVLDLYWSPFSIILPLGSFNNASLKHLHVPLVCGCLFVVSEQDCTKTTLSWISKLHFKEFENYIAELKKLHLQGIAKLYYAELQNITWLCWANTATAFASYISFSLLAQIDYRVVQTTCKLSLYDAMFPLCVFWNF